MSKKVVLGGRNCTHPKAQKQEVLDKFGKATGVVKVICLDCGRELKGKELLIAVG